MKNGLSSLLFISMLVSTASIYAIVCPAGSLTGVAGSPFPTSGINPNWITYSPLINGKLFAAATNGSNNKLSVWEANTTTGVFTDVSPFPLTVGSTPSSVAYSPVFNGQIHVAVANNGGNSISLFSSDPVTGVLTPVSGSPFTVSHTPLALTYSPILDGNLYLAVTNAGNNTVTVYAIDPTTGALGSQIAAPFTTGSSPNGVSYSPILDNGHLYAMVTNGGGNSVSIFQVNTTTGIFTLIQTVSIPIGIGTAAYSPEVNGNLFVAVTDFGNLVHVYQVNTTTGLLSTPGSSFTAVTSEEAYGVAFSPVIDGNLFAAVGNFDGTEISIFGVNTSTGFFTRITGPFNAGTDPSMVAFSPIVTGGVFLAAANFSSNNASVFSVAALTPIITTPSFYTSRGTDVTINATISNGTSPFTIVWNDGFKQTVNATSVSRTVKAYITSTYYMLMVTDNLGCVAGPSNQVTIGVLP